MENKNLATVLRESLSQQDLIDLGLIRNPIIDPHHIVNEIKETLSNYQDIGDELGIEYNGALTASDEPTQRELEHALDQDQFDQIKMEHNPTTKRSNFWYVEKQRNEANHYTRYILANGSERIVTDDELIDNPYLQYQRNLSDAREDGDFDEYNRLKDEWKATHFKSSITTDSDSYEQCFLKVGTKLYGDVMNIPNKLLSNYMKADKEFRFTPTIDTSEIDEVNHLKQIHNNLITAKRQLISYMDMFQSPVKTLLKLNTKTKLVNINNKTMAIL